MIDRDLHLPTLHVCVSDVAPLHVPHVPPPHVLVRVCAPVPHVVLHAPQLLQPCHALGVPVVQPSVLTGIVAKQTINQSLY